MPDFGEFFALQLNIFKAIWPFVKLTWWAWLPPLLFYSMWEMWKLYLKQRYYANLKWTLIEVKIPRDVAKPPQAMEQVFAGIHSAYRSYDFEEKYWQGLRTDHFSFEMISMGGKLHFFIYTPVAYKNLIESMVYAQYPDSEIKEVADYTLNMPESVPDAQWNLFGTEYALAKPDPYPIRTYKEFLLENIPLKEEERKVDPLSAFGEVLAKIKPHEVMGIQILVRPIGDDWKDEAESLVAKLIGKEMPTKEGVLSQIFGGLSGVVSEVVTLGATMPVLPEKPAREEKKTFETRMLHMTPGEKEVLEAIEKNITKIAFQTIIRLIYLGRTDEFDMMNIAAMFAAFRQFNTQNLNSFKNQTKAMTSSPWYNPWKERMKFKKKKLFYRYFKSRMPFLGTYLLRSKPFIFNIEELATIYHYPGGTVGALTTHRIEAKKSEPPRDLPI